MLPNRNMHRSETLLMLWIMQKPWTAKSQRRIKHRRCAKDSALLAQKPARWICAHLELGSLGGLDERQQLGVPREEHVLGLAGACGRLQPLQRCLPDRLLARCEPLHCLAHCARLPGASLSIEAEKALRHFNHVLIFSDTHAIVQLRLDSLSCVKHSCLFCIWFWYGRQSCG